MRSMAVPLLSKAVDMVLRNGGAAAPWISTSNVCFAYVAANNIPCWHHQQYHSEAAHVIPCVPCYTSPSLPIPNRHCSGHLKKCCQLLWPRATVGCIRRLAFQCRVRMAMTTHQAMQCRLRICMLIEGSLHACVDMSGPSDCF